MNSIKDEQQVRFGTGICTVDGETMEGDRPA